MRVITVGPVWRQLAGHQVHAARIRCTFADGCYRSPRVLFPFKEYAADPPSRSSQIRTADRVFIAARCLVIAQVREECTSGIISGLQSRDGCRRNIVRQGSVCLLALGTIPTPRFSLTTRLSIFNRSRYLYSLFSMLRQLLLFCSQYLSRNHIIIILRCFFFILFNNICDASEFIM